MSNLVSSTWIGILFQPRATIRKIIETQPSKHVILLGALVGIYQFLNNASGNNLGESMPLFAILGLAITAGPIAGIAGVYLGGALFWWTGKLLKGQASPQEVRAAFAWSSVPSVLMLPLVAVEIFIMREALFSERELILSGSPSVDLFLAILLFAMGLAMIVASIWQLVLLVKCLSEVNGFSAWRALATLLLPVGLLLVCALSLLLVSS